MSPGCLLLQATTVRPDPAWRQRSSAQQPNTAPQEVTSPRTVRPGRTLTMQELLPVLCVQKVSLHSIAVPFLFPLWKPQCGTVGCFLKHLFVNICTTLSICYECSIHCRLSLQTPGYYCVPALTIAGNAASSKTSYPEGYYCPNGTGYDWKSCPVGTYSNVTGLSKDSDCTPCPGGYYCQGNPKGVLLLRWAWGGIVRGWVAVLSLISMEVCKIELIGMEISLYVSICFIHYHIILSNIR
jgi:hypothetical protein